MIFKKFIAYYKPYMGLFSLDMIAALILSAVDLTAPLIISSLINEVFFLKKYDEMLSITLKSVAFLLILYFLKMVCEYFVTSYGHIMGAKMEADMRKDLFCHMEKLSFSYYDKNNTGVMMSRIVSDLFDVTELAHHGPEDLFISAVKFTGAFLILFSKNVETTLILIAVTVVMGVFTYHLNRRMRVIFMDNRKKIGKVNAVVQDSLSGIRVVQSFSNEHIELQKFEEGNQEFFNSKEKSYMMMGKFFSINGFFQGIMFIVVLASSAYSIARGTLNPKDVVVYILYINMYLEPVKKLLNFTEQFQKGFSGFKRMVEILDTDPEITDREGAVEIDDIKGNIVFSNVSFKYDDSDENHVLQNVNIDVEHGKTLAIVGPSGVGKSTFCSLIPRFYEVTKGAIFINNIDIRNIKLASLRNQIGVVQQDVYIFNSTIRDNIAYGKPDSTLEEIIEAAKKANIHDFIMSLDDGYNTLVGERGVRFSGGQKQRISIARVFLKNPPLLILDEATSSLDNESEKLIQKSLEDLSKNRTTIVIAHRLSTIKNSDTIILLSDKGIAEKGTHNNLLQKNGQYANLYNMQFSDK